MTPGFIEAVLNGRREEAEGLLGIRLFEGWPDADERYLHMWHDDMTKAPQFAIWRARVIVPIEGEARMIGHAGFHGPPDESSMVEIGYTTFEPFRGKGYAIEAAQRLIDFAAEQGVKRVRASVSPGNGPSLAIVRKLGFVQTGEQMDEIDGLELVFERPV